MDKADYTDCFGAPLPCPNRPEIYDESIADGSNGVIHTKAKAIHRSCITNWDTFEAADRETQSFIIDTFDEAWYSELFDPVTFYAQVTTFQGTTKWNRGSVGYGIQKTQWMFQLYHSGKKYKYKCRSYMCKEFQTPIFNLLMLRDVRY